MSTRKKIKRVPRLTPQFFNSHKKSGANADYTPPRVDDNAVKMRNDIDAIAARSQENEKRFLQAERLKHEKRDREFKAQAQTDAALLKAESDYKIAHAIEAKKAKLVADKAASDALEAASAPPPSQVD